MYPSFVLIEITQQTSILSSGFHKVLQFFNNTDQVERSKGQLFFFNHHLCRVPQGMLVQGRLQSKLPAGFMVINLINFGHLIVQYAPSLRQVSTSRRVANYTPTNFDICRNKVSAVKLLSTHQK